MVHVYCRMKMVSGDFTLRDIAACFVLPSATFICVFLEKSLMIVEATLVQEGENGYVTRGGMTSIPSWGKTSLSVWSF